DHRYAAQMMAKLVAAKANRASGGGEDDGEPAHQVGEGSDFAFGLPARRWGEEAGAAPADCVRAPSPIRPKIMRPCLVCRALVTVNSISWLTCDRPCSTTTIVPSARYPTPCPGSSPGFIITTDMRSPGRTTGLSEPASSLRLI